ILSEEDIQLEHNITSREPCSVFISCVVRKPDVAVTWTSSSALNVTGHVLYIADARSSLGITCAAQNPISNVTKTVKPSELCGAKQAGGERRSHTGVIIMTVLGVIAVVGITGFLHWKVKKDKTRG
ncbi:SLAM family member 5-like, partial [Mantella aurantiaca]